MLFHPVVNLEAFATRKALSEHCRSVVADGVSTANAGRVGDWEGAGGAAPVPVS